MVNRRPAEEDKLKALVTALHSAEDVVEGFSVRYPYAVAKILKRLLKEQGVKMVTMSQPEYDTMMRNIESLHPDYRR